MIAKVTQRTELGPSRGLVTARHARVERGSWVRSAQCAQSRLAPDVVWNQTFAQAARRV